MQNQNDNRILRTADGKEIPFSDVTHWHWSNIYWYNRVFMNMRGMPKQKMEGMMLVAQQMLDKNFNRITLPWIPKYKFELEWLNNMGLVKDDKIYLDGEVIGQIKINQMIDVEL